jgi:hypothetical protein
MRTLHIHSISTLIVCIAILGNLVNAASGVSQSHRSARFQGVKANIGTVTHTIVDGKDVLTLSDDFKTPDAPAPHWQLVDSRGNVFLLQRLMVKDGMTGHDKLNKSIVVPAYIADIAKVQIWCAWAETLLGETSFDSVVPLGAGMEVNQKPTTSRFSGVKANTGSATLSRSNGRRILTLSDDFVAPDAPAPHWQLVDSRGNVYLLQSLNIKGGKMNRSIVVPSYVPDIAKVQMWCAYAEVLLGEASFDMPVG